MYVSRGNIQAQATEPSKISRRSGRKARRTAVQTPWTSGKRIFILAVLCVFINMPKIIPYLNKNENLLLAGLCLVLVCAVFLMTGRPTVNADAIAICEYFFVALYLFFFKRIPPFVQIINNNRFISIVFALWLVSITISLFNSPLSLHNEYFAVLRYVHTITHVIFFLFVWDLVRCYKPDFRLLFYVTPLASLIVAAYYLIAWNLVAKIEGANWMYSPPFNSNIRLVGFQIEAAIGFFLAHYINRRKVDVYCLAGMAVFIALWAFLFWTGGRGAILSVLAATSSVWAVLYFKKAHSSIFLIAVLVAIVAGELVAELLAVYDWNGLISSFRRSLNAESLNKFSSSRIVVWKSAWESVEGHLLFGLGSQGYAYGPGKLLNHLHPHNIFLQFLVEWGLIGTLLFLIILARGFLVGLKLHVLNGNNQIRRFPLAAGAVIFSFTINSLIDGTYYHPQPLLYLAIAFAVWIVPSHKKKA